MATFVLEVELENPDYCTGCPAYSEYDYLNDLGESGGECRMSGRMIKAEARPVTCPLKEKVEE